MLKVSQISFAENKKYGCCTAGARKRLTCRANDCVSFGAANFDICDKKLAFDCANLAGLAYPKEMRIGSLPKNYSEVTKSFSNLELGDVIAKVFLNERDKHCVVAYSGTYSFPELMKNAGSILTGDAREHFVPANRLFEAVKNKYPGYEIIAVGHSAGGGLAQYVAAKHDAHAITYAAAGIGQKLEQLGLSEKSYQNIINYTTKSDVLINNPIFEIFENIGRVFELPINSHSLSNYISRYIYNLRKEIDPAVSSKITPGIMVGEFLYKFRRFLK